MTLGLLDTSFIVRYLTGEPPDMADTAARVIDGSENVAISAVGLVESAHVLSNVYGVPRDKVVDALLDLLQKENIGTVGVDKATLAEALLLCRPFHLVSFSDAVLWAEARSAGIRLIYTFDRSFPSESVELRHG